MSGRWKGSMKGAGLKPRPALPAVSTPAHQREGPIQGHCGAKSTLSLGPSPSPHSVPPPFHRPPPIFTSFLCCRKRFSWKIITPIPSYPNSNVSFSDLATSWDLRKWSQESLKFPSWEKTQIDISPKKIYKWPTSIRKGAQPYIHYYV